MMSFEETFQNITKQTSVFKIGKNLAILLATSYLFFGYTNGMQWVPTLDMSIKNLNIKEEFF